jgi:hypothetical protein
MLNIENILFNTYKHHLLSIKKELIEANELNFRHILLKIGNSQMDLYIGNMSVEDIKKELVVKLNTLELIDKQMFIKHLQENNFYFSIKLSDESVWVMREGRDEVQYVHIHPARYSINTLRVKANTLKTAMVASKFLEKSEHQLQNINDLRKIYLNLSPIKNIEESQMIVKISTLF